jgi:protocatechuate 3,4-dioxygenase beta subunit
MIPLARKSTATLLFLTLAVAGAGIGLCAYQQPTSPAPKQKPAEATKTAPASGRTAREKPSTSPIEVSGQVLDPEGKPLEGARLYLGDVSSRGYGFHRKDWSRGGGKDGDLPLEDMVWPLPVRVRSGKDGTFRFTCTLAELSNALSEEQGGLPAVIAAADGFGPGWVTLGKSAAPLTLRLARDDVPIAGRILDEDGKAIAGVKVRVLCLVEKGDRIARLPGPIPGQPGIVATGADGRFRLRGLGRDRTVILGLEGPTIEHRQISARTVNAKAGEKTSGKHHDLPATFTYLVAAGRLVRGVVRDKATGKPVAGVRVKAWDGFVEVTTDKEGRYELPGCAKAPQRGGMLPFTVTARPATGQLYFSAVTSGEDPPGLAPVTANFNLSSGIVVRGKVKGKGPAKKPAVAIVEYHPLFPNPHARKIAPFDKPTSQAVVGSDGSYSLVVLPGPGVLCVSAAPRNAYTMGLVTRKELAALFKDDKRRDDEDHLSIASGAQGQSGILQERYNAFALINPGEKETALTCDLELRAARELEGTVVGSDGKTLAGITVLGLHGSLEGPSTLEGASFLVKRLSPGRARKIIFRYREKNLAALVTLRGDEKAPLAVRLGPCGSVTGRLVEKNSKVASGVQVRLGRVGWVPGEGSAQTDRDGRFRIEGLVAGERYYVQAFGGASGWHKEFTATAKESDLGDLTLVREE